MGLSEPVSGYDIRCRARVLQGHNVGATYTLSPGRQEAFALDLTQPAAVLAKQVEALLGDEQTLKTIGNSATYAARAYDEAANAAALLNVMQRVCTAG